MTSWPSCRGRTIEPVIRESLARLGAAGPAGADGLVGGYWTRTNHPEIDIVIADRQPATSIPAVGSIKWLENAPFDHHDLAELLAHRRQLPGATDQTTPFAVSRFDGSIRDLLVLGPDHLLAAWWAVRIRAGTRDRTGALGVPLSNVPDQPRLPVDAAVLPSSCASSSLRWEHRPWPLPLSCRTVTSRLTTLTISMLSSRWSMNRWTSSAPMSRH